MSQPSILIITNRVPFPLNDGGNLATYSMVKGYHEAGWRVYLFSMNTTRHFITKETLPSLFHEIDFESFEINTDIKAVGVLINFFLSKKPNHAERFFSKQFENRLTEIIQEFQPVVVQLESIFLSTYINSIRNITTCSIAIRLHNIEHQIWESLAHEMKAGLKKIYLQNLAHRIKKFELEAWQIADVLIPITQKDADCVKDNIHLVNQIVVPYGICVKERPIQNDNEAWHGYHLGAMDWVPNAEAITWFLNEVWPTLHEELPEFQFFFAGRNMPYSFHKYHGNGVHCVGEVLDAASFIADKKMLIVPLHTGGGIRVKVLEAMAMGKLIIATSISMQGIDEAKSGIHFLQANTASEFRNQIVLALKDKTQATIIAENGKKLVQEKYNEGSIMKSLDEFMRIQINISKTQL